MDNYHYDYLQRSHRNCHDYLDELAMWRETLLKVGAAAAEIVLGCLIIITVAYIFGC